MVNTGRCTLTLGSQCDSKPILLEDIHTRVFVSDLMENITPIAKVLLYDTLAMWFARLRNKGLP